MPGPVRVVAVASAGGHWVQLMRLRAAFAGCEMIYVTTDPGLGATLRRAAQEAGEPAPDFRVITEANRWQKLRLVRQLVQVFVLMLRLRPDAVISTGAAPGYFCLRFGKLFGARTVWVDSVANAEEMSLSGQKVRPYADLWLTQWAHLERPGGPRFLGSVL